MTFRSSRWFRRDWERDGVQDEAIDTLLRSNTDLYEAAINAGQALKRLEHTCRRQEMIIEALIDELISRGALSEAEFNVRIGGLFREADEAQANTATCVRCGKNVPKRETLMTAHGTKCEECAPLNDE